MPVEVESVHGRIDIDTGASLRGVNNLVGALGNFRVALGAGAASLAVYAGARGLQAAVQESIAWEQALANVAKTVEASDIQVARLGNDIIGLSDRIPIARDELAELASIAGQLGVEIQNIPEFVETVAALGVSTNLSASEAATALARLANVLGTSEEDFDRLGSSVVDLGNNLATTEREILELAQRLAAAGRIIGLSEGEVLGFAGALSSVGIQAEAGGTAFSRLFLEIQSAVISGGAELEAFSRTAGLTAEGFREAFEEDAARAIQRFIEGVRGMIREGRDVQPVLQAVGLNNVRVRNSVLSAAQATDVLAESLERGNTAFEENTALAEEASRFYGTTASQTRLLQNQVDNLQLAIGQDLLPVWRDLLGVAADFLRVVRDLNSTPLSLALPPGQAREFDALIEDLAKAEAAGGVPGLVDRIGEFIGEGGTFGRLLQLIAGEDVGRGIAQLNLLGRAVEELANKSGDAVADGRMDELGQLIFDLTGRLREDVQPRFLDAVRGILEESDSIAEASERIRELFGALSFQTGGEDLRVQIEGATSDTEDLGDASEDTKAKIDALIESLESEARGLAVGRRSLIDYELAQLGAGDAVREHARELLDQIEALSGVPGAALAASQGFAAIGVAVSPEFLARLARMSQLIGDQGPRMSRARQEAIQLAAGFQAIGVAVDEDFLARMIRAGELFRDEIDEDALSFDRLVDSIEAGARGLIDFLQAVDALSPSVASLLTSVVNLGSAIAGIASAGSFGAALPFIGGALGAVGNLFSGLFGESEEDRRRRENEERLELALIRLRGSTDELADAFRQFAGDTVQGLIRLGREGFSTRFPGGASIFPGTLEGLESFGLTINDLERAARLAGIPIDHLVAFLTQVGEFDPEIAADQFDALVEAIPIIADAMEGFGGAVRRLRREFELFDITDPVQQLARLRDTLLQFTSLPEDVARELAGLDFGDPGDLARFEEIVQELFLQARDLAFTGGLDQLSQEEFEAFLVELERIADQVGAEGRTADGETVEGFRVVRQITEESAGRMIAVLTTISIILDQIRQLQEIQVERLGGIVPPEIAGGSVFTSLADGGLTVFDEQLAVMVEIRDLIAAGGFARAPAQVIVQLPPGGDGGLQAQQFAAALSQIAPALDIELGARRADLDFFTGQPRVIRVR